MKSKNKQLKVCANTERISYTGLLPAKDLFIQCYQCSAKLITVFRGCFCFTDEVLFHFSFHLHPVQRFDSRCNGSSSRETTSAMGLTHMCKVKVYSLMH